VDGYADLSLRRLLSGISPLHASAKSGIPPQRIRAIERGDCVPQEHEIVQLRYAYKYGSSIPLTLAAYLRHLSGLSLRTVAAATRVSPTAIRNHELGRGRLRQYQIETIEGFLLAAPPVGSVLNLERARHE
jgi:hypothetical protein